jgi:hypothetical protein
MTFTISLWLIFSIAGLAQSITISSNFGPGGTFNPSIGYGLVYPAQMAYPFTVSAGTNYAFVSAALALSKGIGTDNSVTISLAADGGGVPGSILETFNVIGVLQTYPNDTVPVKVTSAAQPLLKAGSIYWLIISAPSSGNGVNWQTANILTTPDLQATRLPPSPWTASPLLYGYNNPGALSVNGVSLMPNLIYPSYGAASVSETPTLNWSPSIHATSYDIYLGTSTSLSLVGSTTATSYTPSALLPNQKYYWQIIANDSLGANPSLVSPFTTGPPLPGSLGVFRSGQWWLDGNGDFEWTGPPDRVFYLGQAADIPIMGDWTNSGVIRAGVFRNGQWWLDLNNDGMWDAVHDIVFSFGQTGDVPVIGDWDGTGVQRIGIFRNGQWWLDMNNDHVWDGVHDAVFFFGQTGDIPLVGDWDNTGSQRIGVFRSGQWWLDINGDHVWDAAHDTVFFYGQAGDLPVVGDWTHTGQTRIGVFRQSQWWLDMNGDHLWDGLHDLVTNFGITTDHPVVAP